MPSATVQKGKRRASTPSTSSEGESEHTTPPSPAPRPQKKARVSTSTSSVTVSQGSAGPSKPKGPGMTAVQTILAARSETVNGLKKGSGPSGTPRPKGRQSTKMASSVSTLSSCAESAKANYFFISGRQLPRWED